MDWLGPSNVDWCEPNEQVTPWISEFANTVSSLPILVLGFVGMGLARNERKRAIFAHFVIAMVGFGSILFHATLVYMFQLMDELPMIFGSFFITYAWMQDDPPFYVCFSILGGLCVTGLMFLFPDSPVPMNTAFVALLLWGLYFCHQTLQRCGTKTFKGKKAHQYVRRSIVWFSLAGLAWGIDRFTPICEWVYMHAAWHLFSGYGAFLYVQASIYAHHAILNMNSPVY